MYQSGIKSRHKKCPICPVEGNQMKQIKSTTRSNNFLSNLVTIILICGLSFVFGQNLLPTISNTRQFNAFNNQARLNAKTSMQLAKEQAKLDRQQATHELRTARAQSFWNGIKLLLIFLFNAVLFLVLIAVIGTLVFYLVRLARKSTAAYFEFDVKARHELRLEKEYTKRLAITSQPDRGLFEGMQLNNFTYSPRTSDNHTQHHSLTQHSKTPKALKNEHQPQTLDAAFSLVITQTFSDLLALPTPANHLALGYDMATQQPVYVPVTSQAIGAISGGGKSSTLTALAAQLPASSIVLCDSHRDSEQGLTNKLAPVIDVLAIDSAESVTECKDAMSWTLDQFNERRTSGKNSSEFSPLIFIADEWLALQRDSDLAEQAEYLAHTLIHEARKFNMHIWIAGQTFKAKHATDAHHAIGQKIIGKMDTKQARMLSGMSADLLPKDTLFLNAGESFLISWNDPTPQKVYTPFADFGAISSDYKTVTGQRLIGFTAATQEPQSNQPVTTLQSDTNGDLEANLSTEEKRILSFYLKFGDAGKVVNEMFKSKTGKKLTGSPRMKKLELVNRVVRDNLQRLAMMEQERVIA